MLAAWVYNAYNFAGWSIEDGKSYLTDNSGNIYGSSAQISTEIIKGKFVTAYFVPIENGNINTDINDNNLF